MKKIYLFLFFALLVSVAAKAYDVEIDGIYYDLSDDEATVTYKSSNSADYGGSVEIPSTITRWDKTYRVTSIGQNAFRYCKGLTSVTIPNSVTSIGDYAFSYCYGLTSVTIPESVTSIGCEAFYECIMASFTIPNSVTSIGQYAFAHTEWFLNQPEGMVYAGKVAYTYKGEMPVNTQIELLDGTLGIADDAFWGRTGLTSITIPNSVTCIGGYAFYECTGLTSITIPNSVTSIGKAAFPGCTGLTSVTIGKGVTSVGESAFKGCPSLTTITIHSKEIGPWFSDIPSIKEVVLGDEVTRIGDDAFSNCTGLPSITIPNSVTSIGSSAFRGCTGLTKVIWLTNTPPEGYYNVGGKVNYVANEQHTALNNAIVYPFLSSMFEVDGIKYVPVSPSERTCDAIDCSYNSTTANVHIGNTVTYKGVVLNVKDIRPYTCYGNKFIKDLQVGDNVTSIGDNAFSNCSAMTSAKLGRNITAIGVEAFSGCSGLDEFLIPESVKTLGKSVFSGCTSLPSIKIPQAMISIGDYAFSGCTALKELVMNEITDGEEQILQLGSNGSQPLFSSCPLDSVYIGRNISYQTSSNYGYSPFYRNTLLRSVTITNKETEISENEFYGCTNLKNVHIGNGITTIGDRAFSGCNALDNFSFGKSVTSIGAEAFSDCNSITKIVSKAANPPTCGTQSLNDINKWTCTLYVPAESKALYQSADQWKEFFFIENGTDDGDDPVNPETKKCAKPVIYYSNGKLTFASETEGAVCESNITDADIKSYYGNEVQLDVTYHISVRATKAGYEDSEVTTATLCWIDAEPYADGTKEAEDAVTEVKAMPILIQTNGNNITVQGVSEGMEIDVYGIDGIKYGSAVSQNGKAQIPLHHSSGSVVIVRVGGRSVKVVVK